jgi:hypothetical protein
VADVTLVRIVVLQLWNCPLAFGIDKVSRASITELPDLDDRVGRRGVAELETRRSKTLIHSFAKL